MQALTPSEFKAAYPQEAREIEEKVEKNLREKFLEEQAEKARSIKRMSENDFQRHTYNTIRKRLEAAGIEQEPEKITAAAAEPVVTVKAEVVTFETLVRQRQKDGLSMAQSILTIAAEYPEKHADFLDRQRTLKPVESLKHTGE
jgi:hypothetical protein